MCHQIVSTVFSERSRQLKEYPDMYLTYHNSFYGRKRFFWDNTLKRITGYHQSNYVYRFHTQENSDALFCKAKPTYQDIEMQINTVDANGLRCRPSYSNITATVEAGMHIGPMLIYRQCWNNNTGGFGGDPIQLPPRESLHKAYNSVEFVVPVRFGYLDVCLATADACSVKQFEIVSPTELEHLIPILDKVVHPLSSMAWCQGFTTKEALLDDYSYFYKELRKLHERQEKEEDLKAQELADQEAANIKHD